MMHLFLVRHGDSPFAGTTDHKRPLSDLGAAQAHKSASFIHQQMQKHQLQPDSTLIICSNALRTQTTAEIIQTTISCDCLLSEQIYYGARVGQWCDAIFENGDQPTLILVGHNPSISHLANHLNPLFTHVFNPACMAYFRLEIDSDGLRLPAQSIEFFTPHVK